MDLVILWIALAALAAVILTLVASPMERRRRVRNDGCVGGGDDGWTAGSFGSDGGSADCSGADAGGCGGDGGGD